MGQWTPAASGGEFEFTPILKPLESFRDSLVVVSNLVRAEANSNHAVSSGCWLTGVPPKRTDGPDFRIGVSVDQVIARQIGQDTTFPSLEVATEDFTGLLGACDPGYSCAYMNTLNWQTPTTPLPMEINPRVVFERMFGGGGTAAERLARMRTDRSLLDFVAGDLKHLERDLPAPDRARLDEYLSYIREIERRIQRAEQQAHAQPDVPNAPVGVPESYVEHVGLLFDLMALAFQADLTRVFTFMMAREVSNRTYTQVGVTEGHHAVSHHQNKAEKLDMLARIQAFHIGLFGEFLAKLDAIPDGDGSLLDNSLLLYGSNMSNSNAHDHYPLPNVLVGGARGRIKGGQHIVCEDHTPQTNLLLTMLDKIDAGVEALGDSTGTISELSA
jgi:hypothetical protein